MDAANLCGLFSTHADSGTLCGVDRGFALSRRFGARARDRHQRVGGGDSGSAHGGPAIGRTQRAVHPGAPRQDL